MTLSAEQVTHKLSEEKPCVESPAQEDSSQLNTAATNTITYESEGADEAEAISEGADEAEATLEYDFHTERTSPAGTPELIQGAPGDGSPGTRGDGSPGTRGDGSPGTRGEDSPGTRGDGSPGTRGEDAPGTTQEDASGTRGDGSPGTRGEDAPGTRGEGAPGTRGEGGPDTCAGEDLSMMSPKDSFSNDDGEEDMEVECCVSQASLRLHFSQSQDASLLSCAVPLPDTAAKLIGGAGMECEKEGEGGEGGEGVSDSMGGETDSVGGRDEAQDVTEGAGDGVEVEAVSGGVESPEEGGKEAEKTALYESIRYSDDESMDDSPSSNHSHQQGGLSIEEVAVNSEVSQLTSSAGECRVIMGYSL